MLFVLSGCSSQQPNNQTDDYYKFNRAGIAEIEGTSQMSDPVKKVVITKENWICIYPRARGSGRNVPRAFT